MIGDAQKAVQEFNEIFGVPISSSSVLLDEERVQLRAKWMIEEINEFSSSTSIEAQADAIVDIIYYALGVLVEMGVDGNEVFNIVHQANIRKLLDNGQTITDKEGKILKPNGWKSPIEEIRNIINKKIG